MTRILATALVLSAAVAATAAPAATVSLSQNQDLRVELHDVSSAAFDFALPDVAGYVNNGGYLKWSTRADGRQDGDGPWGDCLECGYSAGGWSLASDGSKATTVTVDFGSLLPTAYVWVRATYGQGAVFYADAVAPPAPAVGAVPVPSAVVLLLGGLGVLAGVSRRRAA